MSIRSKLRLTLGIGSIIILIALLVKAPLRSNSYPLAWQTNRPASGPKAPELKGRPEEWLNSKPVSLFDDEGKPRSSHVYVLTFWTFACINCTRTVPFWNNWAKRYAGTDVRVLSVHTPELQFDRKPEKVRDYLKKNGIVFPVRIDNDYAVWNAFRVKAWPTTILIDKQGRIRARWEGELDWNNSGEYARVEQAIETLRKEKP